MIAPASLKHHPAEQLDIADVDATPGHDCPGLIEAGVPTAPSRLGAPTTPGHDCPGLIEAEDEPNEQSMKMPTPGHDCPGLIEAGLGWGRRSGASGTTPGHDCPGLIEAGGAIPSSSPAGRSHSGA